MSASLASMTAARMLSEQSEAATGRTIDRLPLTSRTLAASVLSARFFERCIASAMNDDWTNLPQWLDDVCERYVDAMPVSRVLSVAIDTASNVVETSVPGLRERFAALRPTLDAVVARTRATRITRAHDTIDEVDVIIDGLLTRLDHSDVLTAEHSRAVAGWSARLGMRLGLSKAEIVHLRRAGMIHDIGKVTTPADILGAPRLLSETEMRIMRNHAEAGALMVQDIPPIANLVPAVRNHHERMDGGGYPDRLRGADIPRIARIVAVADSFNAMIGRRPYRAPFAPSIALQRLVEARGTQFDADIVDAMVEVVQPR